MKIFTKISAVREKLLADGYNEVMTYSFTNKGEVEVLASASDKKLSHAMYELTYARINDYAKDYVEYIPVIAAASFFFALKTVSVLFYFLSIIIIYLLVKLLIAAGFIKKELIPETRETLV